MKARATIAGTLASIIVAVGISKSSMADVMTRICLLVAAPLLAGWLAGTSTRVHGLAMPTFMVYALGVFGCAIVLGMVGFVCKIRGRARS